MQAILFLTAAGKKLESKGEGREHCVCVQEQHCPNLGGGPLGEGKEGQGPDVDNKLEKPLEHNVHSPGHLYTVAQVPNQVFVSFILFPLLPL